MKIRKSKFMPIAAVIVMLSLLGGAYFISKPDNNHKSILIGGSSTVHQYTLALAEEFMIDNKGTSIYCESGGSTPGLLAVRNGAIDIATMSRDLEADEDDGYIKNYLIGKDGVGIVVHPSNPLTNLTVEQVRDIFSGAADNWSAFGGSDSDIMVVGRNSGSTTYKALSEVVLKGSGFKEDITTTDSAEEMCKAVASNPDAIGFLALRDLNETIKVIDVNGVPMSRATILTDRYPISRSFYFVVYDKPDNTAKSKNLNNPIDIILSIFKAGNENAHQLKIETVMSFLDFVKSSRGQKIIEENGAIAVY